MNEPILLEMFGGFRVVRAGEVVRELPPHKLYALLACLALAPDFKCNREELIARFWPDAEAEEGRQNLRQFLYTLKRELKQPPVSCSDLLLTTRTEVRLNRELVQTDVAGFEVALREAHRTNVPEERQRLLARAAELYRGELLPGFYQDDLLTERNCLAQAHLAALQEFAQACEQAGETDGAIRYAQQVVALDPLIEEAHCLLMRLYAAAGQPAVALRQYQELERVLETQIGSKPAESARLLMERLRQNGHSATTARSLPAPVVPIEAETSAPEPLQVPSHPASRIPHPSKKVPGQNVSLPARRPRNQAAWFVLGLSVATLAWLAFLPFQNGRASSAKPEGRKQVAALIETAQADRVRPTKSLTKRPDNAGARVSEPTGLRLDIPAERAGPLSRRSPSPLPVRKAMATPSADLASGGTVAAAPRRNAAENGKELWIASLPSEPGDVDRGGSEPVAVATDRAGAVYVCGFVHTKKQDVDCVTLKYSPAGELLWQRRYNGPANDCERPASMALDEAGNVFVAGESYNGETKDGGTGWDAFLVKYDTNGERLWAKRYDGPNRKDAHALKVVVDQAGRAIVGVHTFRVPDYGDYVTLQYASDGTLLWERTYNAREDAPPGKNVRYRDSHLGDVALDRHGNVLVTGRCTCYEPDGVRLRDEYVTLKYAPNGAPQWKRRYASPSGGGACGQRIAADAEDNVYVAGVGDNGAPARGGTGHNLVLVSYGPDGQERWVRAYTDYAKQAVQGMRVDPAGNAFVAAGVVETADNSGSWLTVRYDMTGAERWGQTVSGRRYRDDAPAGIALDSEGNVLVAGVVNADFGRVKGSWLTLKYAPDGQELWRRIYASPGATESGAMAVASDVAGNVLVAGQVVRAGSGRIVLIKYAP